MVKHFIPLVVHIINTNVICGCVYAAWPDARNLCLPCRTLQVDVNWGRLIILEEVRIWRASRFLAIKFLLINLNGSRVIKGPVRDVQFDCLAIQL